MKKVRQRECQSRKEKKKNKEDKRKKEKKRKNVCGENKMKIVRQKECQ